MKSLGFRLLGALTIALLVACCTIQPAQAQGFTGKFTLPFEVRWGIANLPAGDYSFRMAPTPNGALLLNRGTHTVAIIYAQAFNEKSSPRDALVLSSDGTNTVVRQLTLPTVGLVLYYAPHAPKHGSAQDERMAELTIPIAATGAAQ